MKDENIKQIKSEIEKFVIDKEDDLIDVVNKIALSDADKIILTFTEPTDILISPINLKVLLDTADENNKAIIAQIVQNPVGVRNAKEAGMTVTEATGTILEEYWNEAEKGLRRRTKGKQDMLQKSNVKYVPREDELERTEIEMEVEDDELVVAEEPAKEKSEFQKKIEEALERSRLNIERKEAKVVEEGGLQLALDQDIIDNNKEAFKKSKNEKRPSLIGKDIAFLKSLPDEVDSTLDKQEEESDFGQPVPVRVANVPTTMSPLQKIVKNIGAKISSAPAKKWAIRIIAPLVAVLVVALWLVYELAPLAKVTVYITSKEVAVEKVFNGDLKANEFNYENGIVPVKKEEGTKSVSGSVTASGKAFRGNKAEGVITIKAWPDIITKLPVTIPAGTVVTSKENLTYEIVSTVTVGATGGDIWEENVAVRATQVGEEYNIAAGNFFTIAGYNSVTELNADNPSAFAGGSKEQYTVLSQADVDKLVKEIKTGAIDEVKNDLRSRTDNGWEIIESTLKADVEGNTKSDIPVGAEADIANVTIEVKGSAMYFKKGELETKMDEVLTKSAQDQDLFETEDKNVKLVLDNSIEREITVEEAKGDKIKIKVVAKGEVKPEISKNEIIKELAGRDWEDGVKRAQKMKYTDKKTETSFVPAYFPEWLRYFPDRQGRIIVTIKEISN
ncbi:MAG TPA: hypothetical protein PLV59_01485 [Candidatus Dojkabacteria bacterium]|nr:hypothetical protein [Candidatus Dojkabacteria bacterium]